MLGDILQLIKNRSALRITKAERAFLRELLVQVVADEEHISEYYVSQDCLDDSYISRDLLDDYVNQEIEERREIPKHLPSNVVRISTHDRWEWVG